MRYGYLDKFEKHETPVGEWSAKAHRKQAGPYDTHRVHDNQYSALMETLPHETPPMSGDEREADWLLFEQKVVAANLSERETIIFDAIVYGGQSLTEAADHLARCEGKNKAVSKTEVARIRDRAINKLRAVFTLEEQ